MNNYQIVLILSTVLLTILLVWYLSTNTNKENFLTSELKTTEQYLHKMFKDIHGIFTTHNIVYWVDGSTLLEAVQYNNFISYNRNINICVPQRDKLKLLHLKDRLRESGYDITKTWMGYRIFPLNGINPKYYNRIWHPTEASINLEDEEHLNYKLPYLDIYICNQFANNIVHYSNPMTRRVLSYHYHTTSDLFPLRQYRFHNYYVYGPNNPAPYLRRNYTSNNKITGYTVIDEADKRYIPIVKGKVTPIRDYQYYYY